MTDRPNALTDIPADLSDLERAAYIRGYAKGCHTFTRKYGTPSVSGHVTTATERMELRRLAFDHDVARHPSAHKAAMAALRKYLRKYPHTERLAA